MLRPEPWLLATAAALSAVLAVVFGFQLLAIAREWRLRREVVDALRDGSADAQAEPDRRHAVLRAGSEIDGGLLRLLADRVPQLWDLHHLLSQSGLSWTLEGLLLRMAVFASVFGVVTALVSQSGWAAPVAFVFGASLPYMYVRRRKTRRILQIESQLPDAIDLIARAVRAGHPLTEGLRMTAEEAAQPLADEFRVTFEEQRFGLPFEEALLGLGDRVDVVDIRILITAILVQREVGGNLSEILERIAETMRSRFNLKRQVRVYTAQGRMSGYTLAALPIIVGLVITVINPDYMSTLYDEPLGHMLLGSAAFLQCIGFIWIRRIVDVRY